MLAEQLGIAALTAPVVERPSLAPDVAKVRLQDRGAEGIQLTTQAHHGHIVAIVS
jgi:hypothetical protein